MFLVSKDGDIVRHPVTIWTDPDYESESLTRLTDAYGEYLRGRARAASEATVEKYLKTIRSFIRFVRSLDSHGDREVVLGDLTPQHVNGWVTAQRKAGLSEEGIASRLSAVKVYSSKYVYNELELTTADLLRKVPRISAPEKPMPGLSECEREAILNAFDRGTYEDVRNKALLGVYLATGLRFNEVRDLDLMNLDRVTGELVVTVKGGASGWSSSRFRHCGW